METLRKKRASEENPCRTRRGRRALAALAVAALALAALALSCEMFWIGAYVDHMSSTGISPYEISRRELPRTDFLAENHYLGCAAFQDAVFLITKTKIYKFAPITLEPLATYPITTIGDYMGMDDSSPLNVWSGNKIGSSYHMYLGRNGSWLYLDLPENLPDGSTPASGVMSQGGGSMLLIGGATLDYVTTPPQRYAGGANDIVLVEGGSLPGFESYGEIMGRTSINDGARVMSVWGNEPPVTAGSVFRVKVRAWLARIADIESATGTVYMTPVTYPLEIPFETKSIPRTIEGFAFVPGTRRNLSLAKSWGELLVGIHAPDGAMLARFESDGDSISGFAASEAGYYVVRYVHPWYGFKPSISYYRWP